MKSSILSILIGYATAFVPSTVPKTKGPLNAAFEDDIGAQVPLGFWDPLGLVADGNQEKFDRLRYVEVKHGRIAMLAFLGQITTRAGIHFGGDIDLHGKAFADVGNGWSALGDVPLEGVQQMIAFIGVLELLVMKDLEGTGDFPGDFRNDSLDFGWDNLSEASKISKRKIELNNGRAAMMGILGLMVHEQLGSNMPLVGQL